jgi:hypothetical protein
MILTPDKLKKMVLVHYGHRRFNLEKFDKIGNSWNKPTGGLWISPIDSKWGWRDWCKAERFKRDFKSKFFCKFKKGSRVLVINSYNDLKKLPFKPYENPIFRSKKVRTFLFKEIDFESLNVDAVFLTEKGQWKTRLTQPYHLYGWDCESILVFNPKSIYQLTGKASEVARKKLLNLHNSKNKKNGSKNGN